MTIEKDDDEILKDLEEDEKVPDVKDEEMTPEEQEEFDRLMKKVVNDADEEAKTQKNLEDTLRKMVRQEIYILFPEKRETLGISSAYTVTKK